MTRPIFLLQAALTIALLAMAWKIGRTPKAPVEAERSGSTRLAWVDRSGAVREFIDLKGRYVQPRLSPDGASVMVTRVAPGKADLWSVGMATGSIRRLTASDKRSAFAMWRPRGDRYFFSFDSQIVQKTAASEPEKLFLRDIPDADWSRFSAFPDDESADGRWLAYTTKHGAFSDKVYLAQIATGLTFRLVKTQARVS